jgi:putative addiction module component (TIGR02574 family)
MERIMVATFASLGLEGLDLEEKLSVVGQLWDDLVASMPPGALLTEAQREELKRRAADADCRPEDGVPWEQVLAASKRRLSS